MVSHTEPPPLLKYPSKILSLARFAAARLFLRPARPGPTASKPELNFEGIF